MTTKSAAMTLATGINAGYIFNIAGGKVDILCHECKDESSSKIEFTIRLVGLNRDFSVELTRRHVYPTSIVAISSSSEGSNIECIDGTIIPGLVEENLLFWHNKNLADSIDELEQSKQSKEPGRNVQLLTLLYDVADRLRTIYLDRLEVSPSYPEYARLADSIAHAAQAGIEKSTAEAAEPLRYKDIKYLFRGTNKKLKPNFGYKADDVANGFGDGYQP